MKAKNISIGGICVDYKDPGGSVIGTQQVTAATYVVTVGGMINGNHHDPNNWSYNVDEKHFPVGQITRYEGVSKYQHHLFGSIPGCLDPLAPAWDMRTAVYNQALERLNSKIRGNLDLSIDLAEAGTTAHMIRGIGNVLSYARSGAWRSTRAWANGWLQWQYGWKPLASDIFEACDSSARMLRKKLTKVKASAKQPLTGSSTAVNQIYNSNRQVVLKVEGKAACHFQMELEIRDWDLAQWTSLNPISIGWELIPYSFVVDWFIDVGSYMRNLETALLYRTFFKSGYVSELYAVDTVETCSTPQGKPDSFGTWERVDYTRATRRRRIFNRTKLTSYPLPRRPTFKVDLGSQRLLSAASLLRQLLKR